MAVALTKRQREILDYIVPLIDTENPPTVKSVAEHFGISHKAASDHIKALVDKKYIARTKYKSGSISFIPNEPKVSRSGILAEHAHLPQVSGTNRDVVEIPVYRRIQISDPFLNPKDIQGIIPIPFVWIQFYKDEVFGYIIRDSAMSGAGICNEDIAIMRRICDPDMSDITLVNVNKQNVLRRFYESSGKVILMPDNPEMFPQTHDSDDITVIGTYIGHWRVSGMLSP